MNKAEFKERINSRLADKLYLSKRQSRTNRAVIESLEEKKERELLKRQTEDYYSE